jgi:hypothetical protein
VEIDWPREDFSRLRYRLYHDESIYEQEHTRIFRGPTWSVLCLEAEIPRSGDFTLTHVGQIPVVVNYLRSGGHTERAKLLREDHPGGGAPAQPWQNAERYKTSFVVISAEHDTDAFRRQSDDFAAALMHSGRSVERMLLPGVNHRHFGRCRLGSFPIFDFPPETTTHRTPPGYS